MIKVFGSLKSTFYKNKIKIDEVVFLVAHPSLADSSKDNDTHIYSDIDDTIY